MNHGDDRTGVRSCDEDHVLQRVVGLEHPVVGEGIRAILADERDFSVELVTDIGSAAQALDDHDHDVVLSETLLHGRHGGMELLRRQRQGRPAILMFSAHAFPTHYLEAVEGGAAGFLSKTAPPEEIIRSIRAVAGGGKAFSAAATDGARMARRRPAPRELEIVVLVASGATNAEIARRLSIGLATVEGVLRRLFDRYSLQNRTALARLADGQGWLIA